MVEFEAVLIVTTGNKQWKVRSERKGKEQNEENVDGGGNSVGFGKRSHNSFWF
jgi:hypothetical protein